ncbi:MAG: hypothetical protein MUC72_08220, partial [Acidobacteria bacterium]|nr:hypothetical protein [Acidobacteriota bacterium]
IDFLEIRYYTKTMAPAMAWVDMRFAKITVRARTAVPDRRYNHPVFHDGYRRVTMSMDCRLRNKS